jgi:hypothetical protein
MKQSFLQQLILYKYRYAVGYALLIVIGIMLLTMQVSQIGPGVSGIEKSSVLTSFYWHWQNWKQGITVVNLPYVLLQKACLHLLGLNLFSIRLASILVGICLGVVFFYMMRSLHKMHVAITATLLLISSSWFLSTARIGTPLIMIPFVWSLMIYSAIQLVRLKESLLWGILLAFSIALALYTPFGVYGILICLLVTIIHPEIRKRIGVIHGPQIALAIFFGLIFISPLGWSLYKNPNEAWQFAGLTKQLPTAHAFFLNLGHIFEALIWYAPTDTVFRLDHLPLLDVATFGLLAAGTFRLFRDWRSIRSQVILISLIVLLIISSLHPEQDSNYALFLVPIYLVVASGLTVLFGKWYQLFPRNPYARSFGLVPILIFVAVIFVYNYQRYFVAWASAPVTYTAFSNDISIINGQIKLHPNLTLVVEPSDLKFYSILSQKDTGVLVIDGIPPVTPQPRLPLLIGQSVTPTMYPGTLATPVVNDALHQSLRFWFIQAASN